MFTPRMMTTFVCLLCTMLSTSLYADQSDAIATLEKAGLVEVTTLDPSIILDMRYATINNFTGKKVYPADRCFLNADVAKRLIAVQHDLQKKNLGLKLFDCYRPFSVQKIFWDIVPDPQYVAKPVEKNGHPISGSRHNKGFAVDLTLVDAEGKELPMPTEFDDFTKKASRAWKGDAVRHQNMLILENAMTTHGFEPLPSEWWHFDGPGWQNKPLLDVAIPAQ
ncbi:M15 family metallopeptidase [Desulfovibrio inopinatus]|uniref:M15 family metallopeptidase n=1 Tax=Desulfovibrio inopinatus TaxID=102109 RepID=UPI00041249F5|nr:M15 family metallopeptidase [Desulfovibrio inopinatus]